MRKLIIFLFFCFPVFLVAQSSRDINVIIQRTIDLHALKQYYSDEEKSGKTPLIIINDKKIPNNLIVFKFNKRVKIMTFDELEKFKNVYKGDLDSYFIFETIEFKGENEVVIIANFRKSNSLKITIYMEKKENQWVVLKSNVICE